MVLADFSVSLQKNFIAKKFLKLPGDGLNKCYIHKRAYLVVIKNINKHMY